MRTKAIVACMLALGVGAGGARADTVHLRLSGGFAALSFDSGYVVMSQDDGGGVYAYGYVFLGDGHRVFSGRVPDGAGTFHGSAEAALAFDLSSAPEVTAWECRYGEPESQCTPLTSGAVEVRWRRNGLRTSGSSGTLYLTMPGLRFRSTGMSRTTSADASGWVLGVPARSTSPTGGDIGVQHGVQLELVTGEP